MAFTDEDLKRWKDYLSQTPEAMRKLPMVKDELALLARLGASEKIVWLMQRFVERQGDAPDCRCDFCYALKLWSETAGKSQ